MLKIGLIIFTAMFYNVKDRYNHLYSYVL